jgi:hypothetical protein
VADSEYDKGQRQHRRTQSRWKERAADVLREEPVDDEVERLERSSRTGDQDRPALPGSHWRIAGRKRIFEHVTSSNRWARNHGHHT